MTDERTLARIRADAQGGITAAHRERLLARPAHWHGRSGSEDRRCTAALANASAITTRRAYRLLRRLESEGLVFSGHDMAGKPRRVTRTWMLSGSEARARGCRR